MNPEERQVLKTLIVENSITFRKLLEENLHALFPNMIFQEAEDEHGCLDKVDFFRPQLIFMDMRLPGTNGLELTRKIKAKYPSMHIIIVTGYDMPEYREAAAQSGATHFICKDSIHLEEIAPLIKSLSSGPRGKLNGPF